MTIEEYAMEHGLSFEEAQKQLGEEVKEQTETVQEGARSKKPKKVVDE